MHRGIEVAAPAAARPGAPLDVLPGALYSLGARGNSHDLELQEAGKRFYLIQGNNSGGP